MDDQPDFRALYEEAVRRREEAERRRDEAERRRNEAMKQLANTTLDEFLAICHHGVFTKFDVQRNELLATTDGLTSVDGKLYPRRLQPWTDFEARHAASFAALEQAFQSQPPLLPPANVLGYIEAKVSNTMLASEQGLETFEFWAVEGCVLDVLPHVLELACRGVAPIPGVDVPHSVSFSKLPHGVVAAKSDEAASEPAMSTPSPSPSRGRARTRTRGSGKTKAKPLRIKPDQPAYVEALSFAKRDSNKLHPDQWCFRHTADGTSRPLFVVEYRAAHMINSSVLRASLVPDTAASFMENVLRAVVSRKNKKENAGGKAVDQDGNNMAAQRDVAKVITQTYHYMVDYGLQYSYATTGSALVFFYLDPKQPTTLYYHLEEPLRTVHGTDRENLKHSAVALVVVFVLMAMTGQYMTHKWKKKMQHELPRWPVPYADMDVPPAKPAGLLTQATLPQRPQTETTEGCGDPHKGESHRRRDQDDDEDEGGEGGGGTSAGPGPSSRVGGSTQASSVGSRTEARTATDTTQPSSAAGPSDTAAMQTAAQSIWSRPVDAPLSPSLPYCTQACLRGLKTGGLKDPSCPNVALHQHRGAVEGGDKSSEKHHPISAEQFRALLVQQLADDMDNDCQNLERFGMYGAIGALFKLALRAYGYCILGKGVQRPHAGQLAQEAAAYGALEACQGRLVPVNLGVVELVDEYWTECGAHISHMMLMAFAGDSLWHIRRQKGLAADEAQRYRRAMERTLDELEAHGVVHEDVRYNNMVWSEELQRVMAIDFDHACVTGAAERVGPEAAEPEESEAGRKPELEPEARRKPELEPGLKSESGRRLLGRRALSNQARHPAKRIKVDAEAKENA